MGLPRNPSLRRSGIVRPPTLALDQNHHSARIHFIDRSISAILGSFPEAGRTNASKSSESPTTAAYPQSSCVSAVIVGIRSRLLNRRHDFTRKLLRALPNSYRMADLRADPHQAFGYVYIQPPDH
jgi:hypothetical protein